MENKESERYEVIIAPEAELSLVEHLYFLATVNVLSAEALREDLLNAIESLQEFPFRCPVYDTYDENVEYRYLLCKKRYRILFTIEENIVYVDDITDCRALYY